ncbi:MAG: DUF4824 family protein [Alteromonadaceae bacterium]|nr:DUF4824 family protein [Alteromonadaceae bacterium]
MKKYLYVGLFILIGTNVVALSGVALNRSGEQTSQLTLTERELTLPYNSDAQSENSGMSLTINWRIFDENNGRYIPYSYSLKSIKITEKELVDLGFGEFNEKQKFRSESRELYWALEFDGALHDAEIKKVEINYQEAQSAFNNDPNDANKRKKDDLKDSLAREKTTRSRLFFMEVAANYKTIAAKYSGLNNVVIVKGLAKPDYNRDDKTFSLSLDQLLILNIMVPLEHVDVFKGLNSRDWRIISKPRYAVDVKWGGRLEPWIIGAHKLNE